MSQELSYLISYAFKYLYPEMQYSKDSNRPTMYKIKHSIQDELKVYFFIYSFKRKYILLEMMT